MTTPKARFSIRRFLLLVGLKLIALSFVFAWLFPATWSKQWAAGLAMIGGTFVLIHLGIAFFEWGFHRYVLHQTIHPRLVRFSRGHRHHHALTPIKRERVPGQPDHVVLNRYPITSVEQYEDSAFPVYALEAFWALFTPILLLLQALLPSAPIMIGGYAAITWSLVSYEVFHAIEHYPYEWWERATNDRRVGWFWTKVYGFHHYHHANVAWNEAISGFFGLPVADWVFGTYFQPKNLLLSGRVATIRDFHPQQQPRSWVVKLDRWARQRESALRHT